MKKRWIIIVVCVLGISLCTQCTSHTTAQIDKQRTVFPNGKRMLVEKTNKKTSQYGIITKHHYGDTHSYSYTFTIEKDDVNWDGGTREPKEILFTQDTVYLKSLTKKAIPFQPKDTILHTSAVERHYEIQEVFEKFVDERYFFQWFGDAYWVTIPKFGYTMNMKKGEFYEIPNDKELTLENKY